MAGRRPKPTNLKVLEGNPGKRRLNEDEPQPEAELPTRPGWLAPEAKREWTRVSGELHRLGLLTRVDRAALAAYCQAWARFVEAQRVLDEKGMTFETNNGYVSQRPEVTISNKMWQVIKSYLIEFGLTPASRSRLQVKSEKDEADPFEAFLSRRREGAG